MSSVKTTASFIAITLLTSAIAQADFRAKTKRQTLEVTGTGPGTILYVTEEYGQLIVMSLFGTDLIDGVPTQIGTYDAEQFPDVSVKLGNHSIAILNMNGQNTYVKGGGAAEFILVGGYVGDLGISSGGGNDYVIVAGAEVDGSSWINTGGGHDICTMLWSEFNGEVDVALGGGHDELVAAYNSFYDAGEICFNGGGGDDAAYIEYNDILLSEFLKKFEYDESDETVEPTY